MIQRKTDKLSEESAKHDDVQNLEKQMKELKEEMDDVEDAVRNPHKAISCFAKMNNIKPIRRQMTVKAFRQKLYLFVHESASYRLKNKEAASQFCKAKEMELVSIDNGDENNFLKRYGLCLIWRIMLVHPQLTMPF